MTCSSCINGECVTPQACQRPLAELQPIRRRLFTRPSREATGRLIAAALGLAGLVFIAFHVGRALRWW